MPLLPRRGARRDETCFLGALALARSIYNCMATSIAGIVPVAGAAPHRHWRGRANPVRPGEFYSLSDADRARHVAAPARSAAERRFHQSRNATIRPVREPIDRAISRAPKGAGWVQACRCRMYRSRERIRSSSSCLTLAASGKMPEAGRANDIRRYSSPGHERLDRISARTARPGGQPA